jgi:hypothetical protein
MKNRFSLVAIKNFLKYAETQLVRANNAIMSGTEALSIALDMEQSIIENKFFEVSDADPAELKTLLTRLGNATKIHRLTVKEALDEARHP